MLYIKVKINLRSKQIDIDKYLLIVVKWQTRLECEEKR